MKNSIISVFTVCACIITSTQLFAKGKFTIASNDVKGGATISEDYVYNQMGCTGKNKSPELHWTNAPAETKSFAVTVYDPDAPTGSGFWHWIAYNIANTKTSLPTGVQASAGGFSEISSDFGAAPYGGPCPPTGKPHKYVFTVHALKVEKLELPAGATNAIARFMIEGSTIAKAQFAAKYGK